MQIKRLSPAACEELYHTALPRDFPAAELKPFAEIQRLLDAGIYEPLLLTDDAGVRLAYAWQVVLPGQRTALLDYFAVRCDLRGGGVGLYERRTDRCHARSQRSAAGALHRNGRRHGGVGL